MKATFVKDPADMSDESLAARVRFHQSTVDMFAAAGDATRAADFKELVAKYQAEIDRRTK